MDPIQQEVLHSEVNALADSVKNCLAAASDRQEQLEKDVRAFKDYEQLMVEVRQCITNHAYMAEETATNIPALKALITSLESKLVSFQVYTDLIFFPYWRIFDIFFSRILVGTKQVEDTSRKG